VNDITFSPDGRYLYAGTYGGPGWSTGAGLLVRIPVNDDGSAAPAELFTSGGWREEVSRAYQLRAQKGQLCHQSVTPSFQIAISR